MIQIFRPLMTKKSFRPNLKALSVSIAQYLPVYRIWFISKLYLQPCRHLSLHEYISRELMLQYNVAVPKGAVASAPEAAREIADRLGMY